MSQPIQLRGVTKTYGPATALRDVSLTFEPGVHALLGPNGAGKTTLFRVVLGLTEPDAGTVSLPAVTVGYGFQEPRFYAGLTVAENLDLFAGLTETTDAWVETLVEACGLERVLHRPAGDLSAGFAKRLDLAIALVDRPDLVVLDEPFADVDDEHRTRLRAFLEDYATDERFVVVSTHHVDWFAPLLDTVTVLADGEIRSSDDVESVQGDEDTLRNVYRAERRTGGGSG